MTSSKPYLIRAFFDWILDNELTPHLLIDAEHPDTQVPQQFVKDGQIVLNISPVSVQNLLLDNEMISFSARFSGTPFDIFLSTEAVLGIYASENGQGMLFGPTTPDTDEDDEVDSETNTKPEKPSGGPSLKVVK